MQRSRAAKVKKTGVQPRFISSHQEHSGPTRKSQAKSASKVRQTSQQHKAGETPLTFRGRTPADDDYIMQLTEEQLGSVHQLAFGEPFPREQFLQYIQSGAPTVVVERNGKRLGYYSYLVGPDGKMHVSAMVIDPHHQSNGVGTQVMKQLEAQALKQGVHTLEVFVQANNERSLAFTRKLGFNESFRLEPNTMVFQKQLRQVNPRPAETASQQPELGAWSYPPMY